MTSLVPNAPVKLNDVAVVKGNAAIPNSAIMRVGSCSFRFDYINTPLQVTNGTGSVTPGKVCFCLLICMLFSLLDCLFLIVLFFFLEKSKDAKASWKREQHHSIEELHTQGHSQDQNHPQGCQGHHYSCSSGDTRLHQTKVAWTTVKITSS